MSESFYQCCWRLSPRKHAIREADNVVVVHIQAEIALERLGNAEKGKVRQSDFNLQSPSHLNEEWHDMDLCMVVLGSA